MSLLHFEIDANGLQQLILDLAATEKQVQLAMHRALARTATSLRTLAGRKLKNELALRTIKLLRKRLKSLKLRVAGGEGVTLWFGLNDMPGSWFKQKPLKTASGVSIHGHEIAGGFVGRGRNSGKLMAFKRVGKSRLKIHEQLAPVESEASGVIERDIFAQTERIFWQHFERDLRARVNYRLGKA